MRAGAPAIYAARQGFGQRTAPDVTAARQGGEGGALQTPAAPQRKMGAAGAHWARGGWGRSARRRTLAHARSPPVAQTQWSRDCVKLKLETITTNMSVN